MNIRNLRFDANLDDWYWPPYVIFRRMQPEEVARYYGHRWYVLIHFLWWEFSVDEAC